VFASPRLGGIEIVSNDKPGAQSKESAEFRYLLQEPETEKTESQKEGDFDL